MTSWKLWSKPRPGVVFLLAVELLTIVISIWAILAQSITRVDLVNFAVIVILGLGAAEASRQVERIRRHMASTVHVNLSSVWTLPAALLTAPSLAIATVVILYGHLWWRIWRRLASMNAYRVVFSASMVILCCVVSRMVADVAPTASVLDGVSVLSAAWMVLVVLVYAAVNTVLAAGAIALLQDDHSVKRLVGSWQDNSIELATLCMGMVTAVLLAEKPLLVLLVLLPLYVLHRSVLVRQLEHAAITDEKTGLLNAATWQSLASNELQRATRHGLEFGLLMVDLDSFSRVNDEYGNLAGDTVLRAVADAMREEVRDYDLCGRFGGEEFVVLLPDTDMDGAIDIATRLCRRIRELRVESVAADGPHLSASIGVATFPDAGRELDEILMAADNAMFAAKDAGRDQVRAVVASRSPERRTPGAAEKPAAPKERSA